MDRFSDKIFGSRVKLMVSLCSLSLLSHSLSFSLSRDSTEVWLAVKKLQKFHVPQFMVDKMKYFMQSVQGKSHLVNNRLLVTQLHIQS